MISSLHRPKIIAALAGLLALASPAGAVQFRLLGWTAPDVNLQFDSGPKAVEISLYTENLSPVYEYTGAGPLVLYKQVAREGKTAKQTSCSVAIPAGARQGLIILFPGDETKAPSRDVRPNQFGLVSGDAPLIYDYLWIDDSPAARPPGTLEFRNFSSLPVALEIEKQQVQLAPRAKARVLLVKGAKRMAFKAAAQVNGVWKLFATNPLPTRNPERMLVILRDAPPAQRNPSGGEPAIQMLSLYDWPPPAPASNPRPVAAR